MKKISKKLGYWGGVIAISAVLGVSLQLAKAAWTEPTVAPPNGNIGAPINTGFNVQTKSGVLGLGGSPGISGIGIMSSGSLAGGWFTGTLPGGAGIFVQNSGAGHDIYTLGPKSYFGGNVGIGDTTPDAGLKLDVEGKVGATEYCDQDGGNCTPAASLGDNIWVSWSRSSGILASNGVSSVTLSSGRPVVNFSSAASSNKYAVMCNATGGTGVEEQVFAYNKTTTNFLAIASHATNEDPIGFLDCVVFGN
jgi:hypothetical protein